MYRILVISMTIIALAACGGDKSSNPEKMTRLLTRTPWRFDDKATIEAAKSLELNPFLLEGLNATAARLKDGFFQFNADSTLVIQTPDGERTGAWEWSTFQGKTALIMRVSDTKNTPIPVDSLTEEILVLGINQDEGTYFKKFFTAVNPKDN